MRIFKIQIFDHVFQSIIDEHKFFDYKSAMQWLKENAVKRGYDYYKKNDQSQECRCNFPLYFR
tara:strand:- start:5243 stop:5431 length:189 start_codon:yes stop_codon:yes gene_type:complete